MDLEELAFRAVHDFEASECRTKGTIEYKVEDFLSQPVMQEYYSSGKRHEPFGMFIDYFAALVGLPLVYPNGCSEHYETKPREYLEYLEVLKNDKVKAFAKRFPKAEGYVKKLVKNSLKLTFLSDLGISNSKLAYYLSILQPWAGMLGDNALLDTIKDELEFGMLDLQLYEGSKADCKMPIFSVRLENFLKSSENYFEGAQRSYWENMSEEGRRVYCQAMDNLDKEGREIMKNNLSAIHPHHRRDSEEYKVKVEFLRSVLSESTFNNVYSTLNKMKEGL